MFTPTYEKPMFVVRRPSPAHPPRTCHRALACASCSFGKKTTLSLRCRANLCLGPTTASLFTDLFFCGDRFLVDLARCLKFNRIFIDRSVITRWHVCLILGRLVAKSGLTCLGRLARLALSGSSDCLLRRLTLPGPSGSAWPCLGPSGSACACLLPLLSLSRTASPLSHFPSRPVPLSLILSLPCPSGTLEMRPGCS